LIAEGERAVELWEMPDAALSPQVPADEANRLIMQTIRSILGNSAGAVFFQVLEKKFELPSTAIAEKPEVFSAALEDFFGSGRKAIERSIVIRLSEQFGLGASSEPFPTVMRGIQGTSDAQ